MILYVATLPKSFISSSSFFCSEFLRVSIYMIMSSADIYVLSSLDALYFSCVIAFLELLIHCWMEMVRADIFVMFLILERKFLVFQLLLCMYVIWGIFIDVLCQFEEILFFPLVCWVFLSWKLLDFVKCFFLHLLR